MQPIFEQAPYRIIKEEKFRKEMVELLQATVYGTNGPLYRHRDVVEKVNSVIKPLSFSLEKYKDTIGTCTFLERDILLDDKIYKAWYSRYLSITRKNQGSVFGSLLLRNIKLYFEEATKVPTIFYAYVDSANPRSSRLLRYIGLEVIRSFETFVFSRIYPKNDQRVTRIEENDKPKILQLLKRQYKEYAFVNFDPLFLHDDYYLMKINNEIVAGIRANVVKWEVTHLPGISGKVLMKLLPHTPFISRLFNPKDFRYIGFEGIYCRHGYEKELFTLMESVCSRLKLYTGMVWIDPSSELYGRIKNAGKWGIMNMLKEDMPVNIVAAFRNMSKEEEIKFKERPAYISSFDLT